MFCPKCGRELVFIYDGKWHVFHTSTRVNTSDRDVFKRPAWVREPSPRLARRLAERIGNECTLPILDDDDD